MHRAKCHKHQILQWNYFLHRNEWKQGEPKNLYRYNFVNEDEDAKKAVQNANNDWGGNIYRYNFVDEDQDAKKAAEKVNKNSDGVY